MIRFNKIASQLGKQVYGNSRLSILSINTASIFTKLHKVERLNFYKLSSKLFSENDDSHSDFKPKQKQEITDENVTKMIDEWVQNNQVVIFMKGTKEMPRCGFSNRVIQLLNFYKIKNFKAVNILENSIVREAVKSYSNWPTYPQLYVKGNLVGK